MEFIEAMFMMTGLMCGLIMIDHNTKYLESLMGPGKMSWVIPVALFSLYNIGLILFIRAL